MDNEKKTYKCHRINIRQQIIYDNKQEMSRDRLYMIKMLKPCFEYFDQHEITNYQNLSETLKKFGFRTDNIKNLILGFQVFINAHYLERNISPIDWIVSRTVKKANFEEKNIIMNRLAFEYPTELFYYTQKYIQQHYPALMNIEIFFNEIQDKIEKIHSNTDVNIVITKE